MGPGGGKIQFARAMPGSASQVPPIQLDLPPRAIRGDKQVRRCGSRYVRIRAVSDLRHHIQALYSETWAGPQAPGFLSAGWSPPYWCLLPLAHPSGESPPAALRRRDPPSQCPRTLGSPSVPYVCSTGSSLFEAPLCGLAKHGIWYRALPCARHTRCTSAFQAPLLPRLRNFEPVSTTSVLPLN